MWALINYWAVLVGAVIHMVVGMAWYSRSLFGQKWLNLTGKNPHEGMGENGKGMAKPMIISGGTALVMSLSLAYFFAGIGVITVVGAILTAIGIWVGFVATTALGDYLFQERPIALYLINTTYYLVSLILIGILLVLWS